MAEPSTTTTAAVSMIGLGLASLFPNVDANALIGAFAGAVLVVVTSNDLNVWKRLVYLIVSFIAGYLGAPEIVRLTPITSTGVAAFFAAALAIVFTLQLMERVKSRDPFSIFKKGG